jgi:hypothetical protein
MRTGSDLAGEQTLTTLHKGTVLACHQPADASSPLCIPHWLADKGSFCGAYRGALPAIIPLADDDVVRMGRQLMDVNETTSQPQDVAESAGLPRPSGFGDDPVAAGKGGSHKETCPPWRPCAYGKVMSPKTLRLIQAVSIPHPQCIPD